MLLGDRIELIPYFNALATKRVVGEVASRVGAIQQEEKYTGQRDCNE